MQLRDFNNYIFVNSILYLQWWIIVYKSNGPVGCLDKLEKWITFVSMIDIRIQDFNYDLPDERIAKYPLAQRDASKLLRYDHGQIDEFIFRDLPELIPGDSIMVFNDTKVVPARLFVRRDTGALIEIFCLEPVDPVE